MSRPTAQTALATLSEAGRVEAHRRWLVLRAHLEDGVPLTRAAAQSGIPHRTLQRWLARYRAGGLAGLGRAVRADRGRSRFPEPLRLLAEGLALRTPAPSAAQVHRQVAEVAEREGWPVPLTRGEPCAPSPVSSPGFRSSSQSTWCCWNGRGITCWITSRCLS
ncbi:MAG TPA: helix-turn-helix domain-containing protein [Streptosporangiaceae bacterium]